MAVMAATSPAVDALTTMPAIGSASTIPFSPQFAPHRLGRSRCSEAAHRADELAQATVQRLIASHDDRKFPRQPWTEKSNDETTARCGSRYCHFRYHATAEPGADDLLDRFNAVELHHRLERDAGPCRPLIDEMPGIGAGSRKNERALEEIGGRYAFGQPGGVWRSDRNEFVLQQWLNFEKASTHRQRDKSDVERIVLDHLENV